MGRVTLELSDATLRTAAALAARKGVPLSTFLTQHIEELVSACDRYERAKASVAHLFPDVDQDDNVTFDDPQQFFDRYQNRSR